MEPYFKSSVQRLYRFANGYGASVVKVHDDTHEIAVIKFNNEPGSQGAMTDQRWYIDYHSPFGRPKSGLTDKDVTNHLAEIEKLEPTKP